MGLGGHRVGLGEDSNMQTLVSGTAGKEARLEGKERDGEEEEWQQVRNG